MIDIAGLPVNPLDWPGTPFLLLYAALAGSIGLVIALLRRFAGPFRGRQPGVDLAPTDMALLAGGYARAADTLLVAMMVTGAADVDTRTKTIAIDTTARRLPAAVRQVAGRLAGRLTRRQFHQAVREPLRGMQEQLAERGLSPDRRTLSELAAVTVILLAVPLLLGGCKVLVGIGRDRPVGFLTVMLLLTIGFGMRALLRPPMRTPAGRAFLRHQKRENRRLIRAPQESEISLAFALAGPIALAGTPFSGFIGLFPAGSGGGADGGCSGSGGDGGGGGCGGCSG